MNNDILVNRDASWSMKGSLAGSVDRRPAEDIWELAPLVSPTRRRLRVLLAEDNPHVRLILRFGLRRLQGVHTAQGEVLEVSIVEAENGAQALQQLNDAEWDLLVADFHMPVLDGGTLLRRARNAPQTRALPVLFVTAAGYAARQFTEADAHAAVLDKPLRAKELVAATLALCGLSALA